MTEASEAKSTENTIETGTGDITRESGVSSLCFCQKCGKLISNVLETLYKDRVCPKCGSKLLRNIIVG